MALAGGARPSGDRERARSRPSTWMVLISGHGIPPGTAPASAFLMELNSTTRSGRSPAYLRISRRNASQ